MTNATLDLEKFVGQRERDGGLAHWSKALEHSGDRKLAETLRQHERQIAERYRALNALGLMQKPYLSLTIEEFLRQGRDAFRDFEKAGESVLWPFIQPTHYSATLPEIRLVKMTHQELLAMAAEIHRRYPEVDYVVTAVPYRKVLYNCNITVSDDGSVHAEFSSARELPSRAGTKVLFSASKDSLQHRFRYSTEDPELRRHAYFAISQLPRDEELGYLPGYYELGVGMNPRSEHLEALFFDCLPSSYVRGHL